MGHKMPVAKVVPPPPPQLLQRYFVVVEVRGVSVGGGFAQGAA
jgi:hypothetical protein